MGTARGSPHLLLFYKPLCDQLVDRRFHKARRNTFSTSMTLPVIDNTRSIVVDIGERYGAYHDLAAWRRYLSHAGFTELEHYYRPTGLPREQQPRLARLWRKSAI
jgi:hypothetical protein